MDKKRNKKGAPAEEKWVPFARMGSIRQPDDLIEGYCIPLDGEKFRIFVANERADNQRGYFLKLMYEWGKDNNIDLDIQSPQFPQTKNIFEKYMPDAWINKGTKYHCYKYIMFGQGLYNKHLALSLMHSIVASIANQNGGTN